MAIAPPIQHEMYAINLTSSAKHQSIAPFIQHKICDINLKNNPSMNTQTTAWLIIKLYVSMPENVSMHDMLHMQKTMNTQVVIANAPFIQHEMCQITLTSSATYHWTHGLSWQSHPLYNMKCMQSIWQALRNINQLRPLYNTKYVTSIWKTTHQWTHRLRPDSL